MTTFSDLKTMVSRDLRDPSLYTFDTATVGDFINAAQAEVGRVAPQRFQDDIVLVEDALSYQLRAAGSSYDLATPFGVAATNLLTCTSHGLLAGDAIVFTALTGGTGLIVGLPYYVIASGLATSTFRLAPVISGTQVDFTTDITAGTFNRVGSNDAIPEIEVLSVELWDWSTTPHTPRGLIAPAAGGYTTYSEVGWRVWDGILFLPRWVPVYVKDKESDYRLRVWGYAPYAPLVNASDVVLLSNEKVQALRVYCQIEGLRRLVNDRALFTQWQSATHNTDVTPAALMNDLSLAQADWRRRERAITVLREAPG